MTSSRDSYIHENSEAILDAFKKINLEKILEDYPDHGCHYLSSPLFAAATNSKDNQLQHTTLKLLQELCATKINLLQPSNPFADGFSETEVDFLAKLIGYVKNPFLRGRLADRVWNSPKYRGAKYARIAIDCYVSTPLTADTWRQGGHDCWQRAISLCMLIGEKGAENRLTQIKSSILNAIVEATTERGFYGSQLIDVLGGNNLADDCPQKIATKLESLAQQFDTEMNFHASGRHFKQASSWFNKSDMENEATNMTVNEAKAFEKEAMSKVSSSTPSHMAAVPHLKSAVKVLHGVPNKHRERHSINEKIRDLEFRIGNYGKLALDEMKTYTTPGIDISDCAAQARSHVSNRPTWDAMIRFANIHKVEVEYLRDQAKESLSEHHFHRFFHTIGFESDGRVGGTIPAYDSSAHDEHNREVILDEMFRFYYASTVPLVVNGLITPALLTLNEEHCLREADFVDLARRSSLVPNDRIFLWGKALFYGFNFDFDTSIHFLAPQIENMVRWHLKMNNITTSFTAYQKDGSETEKTLCTLMELQEVDSIFGPDWTYEIKTLFCGRPGWNLRNNVAHGLISDHERSPGLFAYAWWLALKMVLNTSPPINTESSTPEHNT